MPVWICAWLALLAYAALAVGAVASAYSSPGCDPFDIFADEANEQEPDQG